MDEGLFLVCYHLFRYKLIQIKEHLMCRNFLEYYQMLYYSFISCKEKADITPLPALYLLLKYCFALRCPYTVYCDRSELISFEYWFRFSEMLVMFSVSVRSLVLSDTIMLLSSSTWLMLAACSSVVAALLEATSLILLMPPAIVLIPSVAFATSP